MRSTFLYLIFKVRPCKYSGIVKNIFIFARSNGMAYLPIYPKPNIEVVQNMNYQEIVSRINDFLAEDFEVEPSSITPEATLKETLDLDSLDYIDLIVAIESNFGFKVKPEDFQSMVTIKDFYDYVANRLQTNITV